MKLLRVIERYPLGQWYRDAIVASGFSVLDKDANSFDVAVDVLDKDGNSFAVSANVLDKDGNPFSVI